MSEFRPSVERGGKGPKKGDTVYWREGPEEADCSGEVLDVLDRGLVEVKSPTDGEVVRLSVRSLVDPPGALRRTRGALRRAGRRLSAIKRAAFGETPA